MRCFGILSLALPVFANAVTINSLNKASCPRSGRIAILGTDFGAQTAASRVTIGDRQAWVTTWTPTRIVAYVDESTPLGRADVRVTDGGSWSNPVSLIVAHKANASGRFAWRFEADDPYVMTRPVVAPDGTIYAKGINGHTYALRPNGSLKWVYNDGLTHHGDMSLMSDGTLVVGGANNVIAIWPDGTRRWQVSGLGAIFSAGPTVGPDGHVYGIANPFYGGVGAFEISSEGVLVRTIGLRTNVNGQSYPYRVVFSSTDWFACLPPPAVGGGAGELHSFRLGGGINWIRSGQGQALRLANGSIYAQRTDNGNNYGAYLANGNVAWSHSFNTFGVPQFFPNSGPDGSVYQVAGGSRLVKFSQTGSVVANRTYGYWTLQYPAVRPDDSLILMNGSYNLTDPREIFAARQDGSIAWTLKLPKEGDVFVSPMSVMSFSPDGQTVYQGMTWNNYDPDTHTYLYAVRTGNVPGPRALP